MTTYNQPPVMTDSHITAMRIVCSLWPYPTEVDTQLLRDIAAHLEALLPAPVPTKNDAPPQMQPCPVCGKLGAVFVDAAADEAIKNAARWCHMVDGFEHPKGNVLWVHEWKQVDAPVETHMVRHSDGTITTERSQATRIKLDLRPRQHVAFDDWRIEYKPLAEPYESDQ